MAVITNPLAAAGSTANVEQTIRYFVNNSSAAVNPGDVVILDGVNGLNVATTTSALSLLVVGVVGEPTNASITAAASSKSYAVGDMVPVITAGPGRINVGGLTVAAGAVLQTSTTAGAADDAAATVGTGIAISLEANTAKDANDCIRCWVCKT